MFTMCGGGVVVAQNSNNEEQKRRDDGINRLNDEKEQRCDSAQLAFPSDDRPSRARARAGARSIETDCLVIVHF